MRNLQIQEGVSDMITVKRRLLSEAEVTAALAALARRYHLPNECYGESDADQMSDFDAQKWLSLCDLLKAARRRSIYGMKAPFPSEELENSSDTLIELAA
jgi:hypothetical protein